MSEEIPDIHLKTKTCLPTGMKSRTTDSSLSTEGDGSPKIFTEPRKLFMLLVRSEGSNTKFTRP